ncbi:MAG: hypothetical protein V1749_12185 [Candidatus Desantisbacteria bacterium]
MHSTIMRDPITQRQLPIIMENGKPKAVVITVERFHVMAKMLGVLNKEDINEAILLSQSEIARVAIDKGILAIKQGKVKPWGKS